MTKFRIPILLLSICSLILFLQSCSDSGTGPDTDPKVEFNSQAAPGDSAQSFLEGDQYTKLYVEIDYMEGYKPTQRALDSLETFLNKHLNKDQINIGIPNSVPAAGQNAYTAGQVRDLEEQFRDHYTNAGSDTLWAYMLFVDGQYDQANVLGVAYYNTSMAFFGPTIHNNSGGVGEPPRYKMEATVFNHEFGHNLGLVNNGTPMQTDHQDSAHGMHCTVEECLMYYSVQTTDYFANLFDGDIPDLDQYCQSDLQANGGK